MNPSWYPGDDLIENSNIYQMMLRNGFVDYDKFWKWSATEKALFWEQTIENIHIKFHKKYTSVLDSSEGPEHARWLKGAQLNIVDSCFQNDDDAISLIYQTENGSSVKISQQFNQWHYYYCKHFSRQYKRFHIGLTIHSVRSGPKA